MSRRQPTADNRPDWRDPDMPVLIAMSDTGELESFPPDEVQAANKHWFQQNQEPDWRNDPTYNLRRRK